jgi:ribose/xylose/arabinose/galactoside ABC-type transport system permease subunit
MGTLVGALIMGVLRNGLNLLGISSYLQQVVIGAVIITAVLVDATLSSRQGGTAREKSPGREKSA